MLIEAPELATHVPPASRSRAEAELLAPLLTIQVGPWRPDLSSDGAGLLVLGGLLIRRMGIDGRYGAELLGEGDLLRPWQGPGVSTLAHSTDWRVLEPTRVAVIDERVTLRLARYPKLSVALIDKAMTRARMLATMAIIAQSAIELRLQMLFWLLADRWGRVGPDGTLVPLRLTHDVLAELTGARRPTVSTALSELARDQRVTRTRKGFLLSGSPPSELLEIDV